MEYCSPSVPLYCWLALQSICLFCLRGIQVNNAAYFGGFGCLFVCFFLLCRRTFETNSYKNLFLNTDYVSNYFIFLTCIKLLFKLLWHSVPLACLLSVIASLPDVRGEFYCDVVFGQEDISLQNYEFLEHQSITTNEMRGTNILCLSKISSICVREGEVLSIVPKADKQCSAVRDLGSWAEELHRVPWIHIKYVKSSSHQATQGTAAGWLPTTLPGTGMCGEQGSTLQPLTQQKKASPRRAGDMLGFCFLTWWLKWAQISEISVTPVQRHICMHVAYTVSNTWISCKILVLQIILQMIMIANLCKSFANYC